MCKSVNNFCFSVLPMLSRGFKNSCLSELNWQKLHSVNLSLPMYNVTCYMLHVTCYMLHVTCYMLHVTCYMLHVTRYTLHVTRYMLHVHVHVHVVLSTNEVSFQMNQDLHVHVFMQVLYQVLCCTNVQCKSIPTGHENDECAARIL